MNRSFILTPRDIHFSYNIIEALCLVASLNNCRKPSSGDLDQRLKELKPTGSYVRLPLPVQKPRNFSGWGKGRGKREVGGGGWGIVPRDLSEPLKGCKDRYLDHSRLLLFKQHSEREKKLNHSKRRSPL